MSVRSLMASGPRCLRCRYVMPSGPAELEFGVEAIIALVSVGVKCGGLSELSFCLR